MSKLTVNDIFILKFQDDVDSFPHRENYENLKNAINDNQDQIDAISTAASGNEVVNARDNADTLQDRLRQASKPQKNVVITGLETTEQGTPDMTVQVSIGYALVNGILTQKTSITNTGTVTAPTNKRWDVVVIESDNSITIVTGNDSNDRVLPAIAISQRPLAILNLLSGTTSLNDGVEITDASEMGCEVNRRWYWKIQDAVDSLDDRSNALIGGDVLIHRGDYYEEVDLSGKSNINLIFENSATIQRISNTARCLKSINTTGNEEDTIRIIGADLQGNGKAGSLELLKFEFTDNFLITQCKFDGNNSSSASFKNFVIDNCDGFKLSENFILNNSGEPDTAEYNIANSTFYITDDLLFIFSLIM